MDYTLLGQRGSQVSRIAFGNWSSGGDWGGVDRMAAVAAARQALDLGITFFDTARAYGFGAAEELLGAALRPELRSRREALVIATKGGLRRNADGQLVRDSSARALREDLEASLRHLGTDYIDLYQIHWPDSATPFAETAEALETFVREGKIRYVGVSNYDANQMAAFQSYRRIDTLQPPYHLFRREIETSILPYAADHGIGVLVYGPLAHGLLAGRMTEATTFAPDDWRSTSELFHGETFHRNLRIVDELKAFAAERGISVAQLAIAWTLANLSVDVAIVGARTPDQIRATASAAEIRLSDEDLARIDEITRDQIPVGGPSPEGVGRKIRMKEGGTSGPGLASSDPVQQPHTGCGSQPGRRVALLGTGKMGAAIADRVVRAGFDLVLWNRTRSRAEGLGIGRVADSPAEAVHDADVVISSLTGPEAIRAAYFGVDGALAHAQSQFFIEMSTAGPEIVAELEAAIAPTDARIVDAPILGSPASVRAGEAAILVGGEFADVERTGNILRSVGEVRHAGPLGSGARLKLVANSMLADIMLAAAELQVAGEQAGLDPGAVFWVLQRLAPSLEARRGGFLENRHTPPLFALRDLAKDLNLALSLYGQMMADVPLTTLARSLVIEDAQKTGELEVTSVIQPYRDNRQDMPKTTVTTIPPSTAAH
jgi:aryl-alcohol dehydrogenase-like predicted oxidoreductase/3-hydroxyisobutyrate dehydrogenase-like beta-hydroxyacid dehydrogenase